MTNESKDLKQRYVNTGANWDALRLWIQAAVYRETQRAQREQAVADRVPSDRLEEAKRLPQYRRFVEHGVGTLELVSDALDCEQVKPMELSRDQREELLKQKLGLRGLELRSDSTLCAAFIWGHCLRNLVEIVDIMQETNWLYTKTTYLTDRKLGKTETIRKFVDSSISNHQYSLAQTETPPSLLPCVESMFAERITPIVDGMLMAFHAAHPSGSLKEFWRYASIEKGEEFCELLRALICYPAFEGEPNDLELLLNNIIFLLDNRKRLYYPL